MYRFRQELQHEKERIKSGFRYLCGMVSNLRDANPYALLWKLVAVVMLIAAAQGRHKYDYYVLLRCVVSGVCGFTAYQAYKSSKAGWLFAIAVATAMMNPIAPLHLKRETWVFVNAAVALALLASIPTMDRQPPPR